MSFILDALRKSEHDRQREKGPGLAEVAVAPPKPKKNIWASVAVALLVVNLVAIGVLLLRRADRGESQAATTTAPAASSALAPSPAAAPPAPAVDPAGAAPSTVPPVSSPAPGRVAGTVPPVLQPALPAEGPSGGTRNPLADELSGSSSGDAYDPYDAGYDDGNTYPTAPPGMQSNPMPPRRGSVVYEQLPEAKPVTRPSQAQAPLESGSATNGGGSSLPTLDDLGGQTGLAELHVDIHVYSTRPEERFVFINSRRYKEGDTLQEGPHVDRITSDGVELSYRGNRFALPRQ